MKFERAGKAEAERLARLHHAHFKRGWSKAEFLSFFHQPNVIAWIAAQDDHDIGFIFAWAVAGECELLSVAVDEAHRGQGIAKSLCLKVIEEAQALEAQLMHLEVGVTNQPAISLYQQLDFEVTGRRKGYYHYPDGSMEDAMTMRLKLSLNR